MAKKVLPPPSTPTDTQASLELWEVEIEYLVQRRGVPRDRAWTFIIMWRMAHGDFRPLSAAIAHGRPLDGAVLGVLQCLIRDDRLVVKRSKRGAPRNPDRFGRGIAAALLYERIDGNSNQKFEDIAEQLGVTPDTVRKDITRWRQAPRLRGK